MSDTPVSLITGGGTGIGAATARLLLDRGHRVAVTGRSKDRLDRFAKDSGDPGRVLVLPGDTADHEAVQAAVDGTVAEFGRLDNVVANAGTATHDGLDDGDPAGWRDMVLTNVLGPALVVRASLAELTKTRGRIVLVGSTAGHVYIAGNIYGITKWAITGLAESTRLMVTEHGIGVTLVSPGIVATPFWDGYGGVPEGVTLSAEEVADAIGYALSRPATVDVNTVIVRPIGQPV